MLKRILIITIVLTLVAASFVFADGNQSALSKVTGLTDKQISTLSPSGRGYGKILTASIVAKLISSDIEDVLKAHQAGATFFEIAQSKGIELEEYKDSIKAGRLAYIDQLEKSGNLTKEQAKLLKERITQQIENCTGLDSEEGFGNGCPMGGPRQGQGMNRNGFRQGLRYMQ